MKTKNIILLIVAALLTLSSVNAQYIENDTRFEDGAIKTTKAMPMTTSITTDEAETMSITTTSFEADEVNTMNDTEAVSITTTSLETEEKMDYDLMYWIGGILFSLVLILIMKKNCKLTTKKD